MLSCNLVTARRAQRLLKVLAFLQLVDCEIPFTAQPAQGVKAIAMTLTRQQFRKMMVLIMPPPSIDRGLNPLANLHEKQWIQYLRVIVQIVVHPVNVRAF